MSDASKNVSEYLIKIMTELGQMKLNTDTNEWQLSYDAKSRRELIAEGWSLVEGLKEDK